MSDRLFRYAILLVSLILSSCEIEKEIDFSMYYDGDKLAVRGYLSQTDGLVVSVHKTLSPTTPQKSNVVRDVTVWLMADNDTIAEATTKDHELYLINAENIKLDNSTKYWICVSSQSMGTVYSDNMPLPSAVAIDSISHSERHKLLNFSNPDVGNCYIVRKLEYKKKWEYNSSEKYFVARYYDTGFPVGATSIKIMDGFMFDSIRYELITLSPEYISFIDSWNNNHDTYDDIFSEYIYPVNENIHGGHGFFGTFGSSTIMWRNPDPSRW